MISVRFGICIDCQLVTEKPLIAGRCQFHYKVYRSKINKEKRGKSNNWRSGKPSEFRKRSNELFNWFEEKMKTSEPRCENCGQKINKANIRVWRGSQHHILEKSLFPSISAHPLNHGVLGMYCCHGQWHTSWENAQKMPFFKIALERFMAFEKDIAPEERRKIPQCFLDYIVECSTNH